MKTVFRSIGIVLGIIIVVIVAAALIVPRVIDSGKIRDQISDLVKEKTGRELIIAGPVTWSVFPWLGVAMGELSLANAPGFGEQPLAQIASVQARVKLLPLLRKEVEMSAVVLDGLEINLAKAKDGRNNWQDLLPAKAHAETADNKAIKFEAASIAALVIGGVQVLNARVAMDDQVAGAQQSFEAVNLQLGEIRPDQPMDVSLDFIAKTGAPLITSAVSLRGRVTPADKYKKISIPDLKMSISAQGETLPNQKLDAELSAAVAYDTARGALEINGLTMSALDLTLRGQATGTGVNGERPRLDGKLNLEQSSPRALMKRLGQSPPVTSDPSVLEKVAAEFLFQATVDSAQLTQVKLQLDESLITGTLGVKNVAKPTVDFNLALDTLDLDRYLPPQSRAAPAADDAKADMETVAATKQPSASKSKAVKTEAGDVFPVQLLRDLNINGTLKIAVFKAYQLRSTDVSMTVSAKNGLVHVFPARANLYQGSYNGDIRVDVRGKQPRIALHEKLRGVSAEPLLVDLLGKAKVTGSADVSLQLSATGNRVQAIRKTLNGNAQFAFSDGVIKGMDVLGEIRSAYALLRGKPSVAAAQQTEFSSITGSATVTNGLVNNPDLSGASPLLHVAGKGTANLVTQQLDYRVAATLVDSLEGKGELTGRPIPVHISGDFAAPKVRVDLEQVLKQEVQKKLQDKLEDTLKDKINSDTLKGLFGR